jgi:hypothetical protein
MSSKSFTLKVKLKINFFFLQDHFSIHLVLYFLIYLLTYVNKKVCSVSMSVLRPTNLPTYGYVSTYLTIKM